jgi:hypothetical protein
MFNWVFRPHPAHRSIYTFHFIQLKVRRLMVCLKLLSANEKIAQSEIGASWRENTREE